MNDDKYPCHSARGITMRECVDGKNIKRCVFKFDKVREYNRKEISIQWLDDIDSAIQMKSRLKGQFPQFVLGFAVLLTMDLEKLKKSPHYAGMNYSREPSSRSKYHGLITVPYEFNDRELAAELAMLSKKYEFEEDLPIG